MQVTEYAIQEEYTLPAEKRRKRSEKSQGGAAQAETRRKIQVERFSPSPDHGLSSDQVKTRVQQGLSNVDTGVKTKSEKQIIKENVFTFFNILNLALAILHIAVGGELKQVTFILLILWNIIIGTFQGIRSKRTIDKLSLISAPKASVIRGGGKHSIPVNEVVLDDILVLSAGNQICSDSIVLRGECEVNESLITGESDPILKKQGDELLSGSFIVSGTCHAQTKHVGAENYASKITGGAGYVKKRNSEIMNSIDRIIKAIGFGIVPIGIIMFYKQYFLLGSTLTDAVTKTIASLIGMIPEGLILLTSIVFAVSVIRLATRKTLVQDLYCVETLARVDVLCLDKTGTITEGTMQVDELMPLEGYTDEDMRIPLTAMMNSLEDDNPTFMAIREFLPESSTWKSSDIVPFSSVRKWSGAYFSGTGSFVMGAGEFILGDDFGKIKPQVEQYSEKGQRVLLLAHSEHPFEGKNLPPDLQCIGLILISDKIRREARRTLRYFSDQGVDLKVISGDNAVTVANIAKKAGLQNADKYVDATTLTTPEEIERAVRENAVFGRVTPQQKLSFVKALKKDGHTVAMTGDGVNDVLALKEADCSIAMASGSDAARTVSTLVLLDSNFASMPIIVQEGRRSINNLQRSSSLFLSKTVFSALIGVLFIFLSYSYPFEPIHLTLISSLTIGAPSFILAMEPNRERLRGRFITNVLKMSVPAGLTMTIGVLLLCALGSTFGITNEQLSTLAVFMTTFTGFMMLFKICVPFNALRGALLVLTVAGFALAVVFFSDLFSLTSFTIPMLLILGAVMLFAIALFLSLIHFVDHVFSRRSHLLTEKRKGGKKRLAKN